MNPIGVVVASHCDLAHAFIASAEVIVGAQTDVAAVCLAPEDNLESCRSALLDAVNQVDHGNGAIVLIDLFGGTPCNAAALTLRDHACVVVTGVNLPMLIEILMSREGASSMDELAALAVQAGRSSIIDVGAQIKAQQSKSETSDAK